MFSTIASKKPSFFQALKAVHSWKRLGMYAGVGAVLGAGGKYYRHRNDPGPKWKPLAAGALYGGVVGALGNYSEALVDAASNYRFLHMAADAANDARQAGGFMPV